MKITTDQIPLVFSMNAKQSSHKYDDKTVCLRRSDHHGKKRKVRWNCDLKFVRSETSTNSPLEHWKFYVSKWLRLSLLFTTLASIHLCFVTVFCATAFSARGPTAKSILSATSIFYNYFSSAILASKIKPSHKCCYNFVFKHVCEAGV